jgi:hypothetical protein
MPQVVEALLWQPVIVENRLEPPRHRASGVPMVLVNT